MIPLSVRACALALSGTLWLSACASHRGVLPPTVTMNPPRLQGLSYTLGSVPAGPWPVPDWIAALQDPQLSALADEVLQGNPDLQIARTRIVLAQSQLDQFLPTTGVNGSLSASAQRAHVPAGNVTSTASYLGTPIPVQSNLSLPESSSSLIAAFNYQLDLWQVNGGVTRSLLAERDAARLDADQARLRLRLSLVSLYFELDQAFAMRDLAEQRQRDLEAIRGVVRERVERGLNPANDVLDLDVRRARLAQDAAQADQRILQARLQLGVLTGAGPERGLALVRPHLTALPATSLPADLPLELLARRPDIVAARMRVESAAGRTAATKARFYPNVNITAFAGLNSLSPGVFLNRDALLGSVGPAISLPVFQEASLQAQLRGDYASGEAAIILYNKTINEAFGEVARQVAAIRSADDLAQQQALVLDAKRHTRAIAEERQRRGIGSAFDVLQADLAWLQERSVALEFDCNRRALQVSLISALGGGFVRSPYDDIDGTMPSAQTSVVPTPSALTSSSHEPDHEHR